MKEFIGKLCAFCLIALFLLWAAQFLVDLRIKNKTTNGHDDLDIVKDQQYDLVFLGSSRCLAQFNPNLFQRSLGLKGINIGVDGHSELSMHILRLSNYLAKNAPPRYVILNLDPLVTAGSFETNSNFSNKNAFARYAYNCVREDKPVVSYFGFNFAEKHLPLYALLKYKQLVNCLTLTNLDNRVLYGYERHDEMWDTLVAPTCPALILKNYFPVTSSVIGKIRDRLDSLKSICDQNNILLICVQTPVYKDIYIKQRFDLTGKICQETGVPFFDCNTDSIDNNMANFYNADHLNTNGVRRMSSRLFSDERFIHIFTHTASLTQLSVPRHSHS